MTKQWIGVDLDETLAYYDGFKAIHQIGRPLDHCISMVKAWLAEGKTVKIFTARYTCIGEIDQTTGAVLSEADVCEPIKAWCRQHIGCELPITATKDLDCIAIYDNLAREMIPNTGIPAMEWQKHQRVKRPLLHLQFEGGSLDGWECQDGNGGWDKIAGVKHENDQYQLFKTTERMLDNGSVVPIRMFFKLTQEIVLNHGEFIRVIVRETTTL